MFNRLERGSFEVSMSFEGPHPEDKALVVGLNGQGKPGGMVACARRADGSLSFPSVSECADYAPFTYLFAVDGVRYFLAFGADGAHRGLEYCVDGRPICPVGYEFEDAGALTRTASTVEAFVAVTGLHLAAWYAANRYCGHCASPLAHSRTERALTCSNCGNVVYPRISPAIIVAVVNGDKLLMTRYAKGNYRRRALVAGFVEVGESAEETVAREVYEECGIHVKNVRYFASQPWGVSGSLMLGYFADLDGDPQTHLIDGELSWAGWVSRDEIEESDDYALGRKMVEAFRNGDVPCPGGPNSREVTMRQTVYGLLPMMHCARPFASPRSIGLWYNDQIMQQQLTDKAQIAVFDFDDTSIEGSSPSWLVNRLIFEHRISPITSLKIGFWGLAYKWRLPQNESWVRGQVFKAFVGKPKAEVDKYLVAFYDKLIEPRFRPKADAEMRKRAEEGCVVVVVSASFEPIVLRAMEKHPFHAQISTRMKVAPDGTYTREVDGRPIEGDEKLVALKRWCDGRFGPGQWEIAYAYGDHHSDEPLLSSAKHPFVVSPNTGMSRIAKAKGWPVLDWKMTVPK